VSHVLIGDGAYGQRGEVDLVGAAEVQQQIERARGVRRLPLLGLSLDAVVMA